MTQEELGEIVGDHRQGKNGFGGPEGLAAKGRQTEAVVEFLDDIFNISSSIVAPPYVEGADFVAETGDQSLEVVARQIEEGLAAGTAAFLEATADQDDAPWAAPVDAVVLDFGDLQARQARCHPVGLAADDALESHAEWATTM